MSAKPKTVTLTHPDSASKVEVNAGDEDAYLSQGWVSSETKGD